MTTFDAETNIPVAIRYRVWGGEGHLPSPAATRQALDAALRVRLVTVMRQLRAAQRGVGTVYGGHDDPRPADPLQTRRIAPRTRG